MAVEGILINIMIALFQGMMIYIFNRLIDQASAMREHPTDPQGMNYY